MLLAAAPRQSLLLYHEPSVTNANLFSTTGWNKTSGFSGLPTVVTERYTGQSITLSLLHWEENGAALSGELRAQFGIPTLAAPAAGGVNLGAPSRVETYVQGNYPTTDASNGTTVRRLFGTLNRDNSDRVDVILSATWDNLPSLPAGLTESNVCVQPYPEPTQVALKTGGSWISRASVAGNVCFTLRAAGNTVDIKSGDVTAANALKSGGGLTTLKFTAAGGQTFVNGQHWTSCGQFSTAMPASCTTSIVSDNTTAARLSSRFAAAAQAARQVAIWGRTGLDATSFLTASQNSWLNPRGEVLYVAGDVTIPTSVSVTGKKVLIASGSITLNNVQGATGSQVAFISLAGNVNITGTIFNGAAIATNGSLNLAGSGKLQITGLLAASQNVSFVGRTSGENTIATLNYDARYQQGDLIGLGAVLRPLVSEPGL